MSKTIEQESIKRYGKIDEAFVRVTSQQKGLDKQLEVISAMEKKISNMKKTNDEIDKQNRQKKGIFSVSELEEKLSEEQDLLKNSLDQGDQKKRRDNIKKLQADIAKITGSQDTKNQKATDRDAKAAARALEKNNEDRIKLVDKWAKTDADYLSKTLSRDQQEIASVKAKYADIRKEIEKHNKETNGKKISLDGFDTSINTAVSAVNERQLNDKKLKQYQEDYQNFNRYEQLKKESSDEYADEQLGKYKDTVNKMRAEYASLFAKRQVLGLSNNEEAYLKGLGEQLKVVNEKELQDQQAKYVAAIQASKSYNEQILDIEEKYKDYNATLGDKATEDQKNTLKKGLEDEKTAILVAQYERIANTEKMFHRLSFLGKKASLDAIAEARKVLLAQRREGISDDVFESKSKELDDAEASVNLDKSWIASTGALEKYRKQVQLYGKDSDQAKRSQKDMFTALASDLSNASSLVGTLTDSFSTLGISSEGFQETVGKIGGALGDMSGLAASIATGNPIAIISSSIKVLTSVVDIFNTKDKKIQKQIDAYKTQLDSLGKSYETLQKKMSGNDTNYYDNSDQLIKGLKEQQAILEKMAKSESEKKKNDKEKVKGYKDEAKAIDKQIEEIENSVRQMRLQTDINSLAQSITDALVGAFEAGENGIDAMDNAFAKFIKNSIANSARLKFVQKIIDDMLNQVDKYMASNDNSIVGFDFAPWEKKLNTAGKEVNDFLESAYAGIGLTKDKDNNSTLSKGIQGVTENTANRLEAEFGGLRLAQLQLLELYKTHGALFSQQLTVANNQLVHLAAIENNTLRTANNTEHLSRLSAIETAIVSMNNKIINSDALRRGAGL